MAQHVHVDEFYARATGQEVVCNIKVVLLLNQLN